MLRENEFIVETLDGDIAKALLSAKIEGVTQHEMFFRAIDPEAAITFVISASSDVAIGLFSAWLYDLIKKRGSDKTKIQGQQVPENVTQIITVIQVIIQNNQAQAEEHRKHVDELRSHDS